MNVADEAMRQAGNAYPAVNTILSNTQNVAEKEGKIDSRYLWPTMVFESVCDCSDHFYGADCSECNFGWTGDDCQTKKTPVIRKRFGSLTEEEKQDVIDGLLKLKSETGYWTVITFEPTTPAGRVQLQGVSTYDYLVYIHNYVSRDASAACKKINGGTSVDFAHSGPNFPVWHRTYLLILERAMQRVLGNDNFGFPYILAVGKQ